MRLPTRLAVIGVSFLAVTLLVVGLLAYEMIRVSGRQEVDRILRRELDAVTAGFPPFLAGKTQLNAEDLRGAASQYLAVHPGSDRHLTVFSFGGDEISTRAGPDRLVAYARTTSCRSGPWAASPPPTRRKVRCGCSPLPSPPAASSPAG